MGFLKDMVGGIGSLVGGVLGIQGQRDANKINKQLGYDQMGWQQMMSNTAHTREVGDLKAAGLNPILSANTGASSPPGALPQVKNEMEGIAASAAEAANLFLLAKKQKAEIGLIDAQRRKTNVEATVSSKDIPKANIINDIYDIIGPSVKKLKQSVQSGNITKPVYTPIKKTSPIIPRGLR